MERILIIGSGGAGKSTLAVRLGEQLRLPVVHLDRLFWVGDWNTVEKAEFDRRLQAELEKPAWIIDGNYDRTLELRLRYADTVLYLDYSTPVCLWGVLCRQFRYRGRVRPDMGGECVEHADPEFLRWVVRFHRDKRPALLARLQTCGKNVYVFRSRRQCTAFLKDLPQTGTF